MNAEASQAVCQASLEKAEQCRNEGKVGRAFAYYLLALKLNSTLKSSLRNDFCEVLHDWTNRLCEESRDNDAWYCYTQALEVFPENDLIYDNLASFLTRYGPLGAMQAIPQLRKCVDINKWNLQALRNLENVCNWTVERWHFRMLNDYERNKIFKKAIYRQVKAGKRHVLDVGTGTGLLSLFAVEAGADVVYACDSSLPMISLAEKVVSMVGTTRIKLIDKHSTDITVPKDIPEKMSLLVCEIVDAGLLGEHILETLTHAWQHLLKPNAVVIPQRGTFHVCGVQSKFLANRSRLQESMKTDLGLGNYSLVTDYDYYDTEELHTMPGGYKIITKVANAVSVNFNDPNEMRQMLDEEKDLLITLEVDEDGWLDSIAGWFRLELDDETSIDNIPNGEVKCWDQAIFRNPHHIKVTSGQQVVVMLSFSGGETKVTFPCNDTYEEELKVSANIVEMLNDTEYVNSLKKWAVDVRLSEESVCLLDMCPFPMFSLTALKNKRGRLFFPCPEEDRAFCSAVFAAQCPQADIHYLEPNDMTAILEMDEIFDVIVFSPVETTGELNDFCLSHIIDFKAKLKESGHLIPNSIQIMGQIVNSDWLQRVSRVLDADVTCGYDIASFINEYKIDHQLDFRIESAEVVLRSQELNLLNVPLHDNDEWIVGDGWLAHETVAEVSGDGPATALVYWYNISTGQTEFSTKISNYFNKSAIFLDEAPLGESVKITTKFNNGIFISRINDSNT